MPEQSLGDTSVRPLGREHDPCARLLFVEENFQRMPSHLVAIELAEIHSALKPLQDAALGLYRGQRITHGRHCTCSSCAQEDWTNPNLSPCGMHGEDCPALYQPWGPAGSYFEPSVGR